MENIVQLYTTTDGRISRKTWWLGAIGIGVVSLVISMLIFPLIGLGGPSAEAIMAAADDPAAISALVGGSLQTAGWASLILFLLLAYPIYCISIKRRHDKNSKGTDVIGYLAVSALLLLVQALGMGYSVAVVNETPVPMPSLIYSGLGLIAFVYAVYMLVVLGFLKGTEGPNQYGPDPLGNTVAATA
ncbi:MAG TPA: DUF805 domain-containing protein [Devosiaceae bacterium]|jgi:uncharacterized membrane protein YhaH (DUF805 family)|nr:DUF805 domain-containing protein [Devosiaceae bacterium]